MRAHMDYGHTHDLRAYMHVYIYVDVYVYSNIYSNHQMKLEATPTDISETQLILDCLKTVLNQVVKLWYCHRCKGRGEKTGKKREIEEIWNT